MEPISWGKVIRQRHLLSDSELIALYLIYFVLVLGEKTIAVSQNLACRYNNSFSINLGKY